MNPITTLDILPLLLAMVVLAYCLANAYVRKFFRGRYILTGICVLYYITAQACWMLGTVVDITPVEDRAIWAGFETLVMLSLFFLSKIPQDAKFK